jgi:hypothetical protein
MRARTPLRLGSKAILLQRVVGDEAEDLVGGEAKRHRPRHTLDHAKVVKLAYGAVDAEPVHASK